MTVNIPYAKALEQMSSYDKFMKQIMLKKKKPEEFETIALKEEYNAVLQRKLPPKLKELGRFIDPYSIRSNFQAKCFVIWALASI